jgi:hypothetical protein
MDTLLLYQKICDIRPKGLVLPYIKPSAVKVQFNLKELELHYYDEFNAYITREKLDQLQAAKKGGAESTKKIIVLDF